MLPATQRKKGASNTFSNVGFGSSRKAPITVSKTVRSSVLTEVLVEAGDRLITHPSQAQADSDSAWAASGKGRGRSTALLLSHRFSPSKQHHQAHWTLLKSHLWPLACQWAFTLSIPLLQSDLCEGSECCQGRTGCRAWRNRCPALARWNNKPGMLWNSDSLSADPLADAVLLFSCSGGSQGRPADVHLVKTAMCSPQRCCNPTENKTSPNPNPSLRERRKENPSQHRLQGPGGQLWRRGPHFAASVRRGSPSPAEEAPQQGGPESAPARAEAPAGGCSNGPELADKHLNATMSNTLRPGKRAGGVGTHGSRSKAVLWKRHYTGAGSAPGRAAPPVVLYLRVCAFTHGYRSGGGAEDKLLPLKWPGQQQQQRAQLLRVVALRSQARFLQ